MRGYVRIETEQLNQIMADRNTHNTGKPRIFCIENKWRCRVPLGSVTGIGDTPFDAYLNWKLKVGLFG